VTSISLEFYEELIQGMQKDQTKQPASSAQEAGAMATSEAKTAPVVLISYTHEGEEHKAWVRGLAEKLRADGVDVILDQWDLKPGQDVLAFMEQGVRQADRVMLVFTPEYRRKADGRTGGVGYESLVITGELSSNLGTAKFIGLLRRGDWSDSVPVFMSSRSHIDFRDDATIEKAYGELLRDIHEAPAHPKPPLGKNPFSTESSSPGSDNRSQDLSPKPALAPELVQEGANVKLALTNVGQITATDISLTPVAFPGYDDGSWTVHFEEVTFLQPRDRVVLNHKNRSSRISSDLHDAFGWTGERPLWFLNDETPMRASFRDQNGRRYSQVFVMENGRFRIKPVELCGEPTAEDLERKERSNFGAPLAGDVVTEEGQEKQPMKSDDNNHTLAERGGAKYGDHARENIAITGGVGRDVVFNAPASPTQPSGVHDYKAIKQYDAAFQLKRAVLEVRNTISSVRSLNSDPDFQSKLNRIDESTAALYAELREAELHWGRGVWQTSEPLRRCVLKLKQYIRRYIRTHTEQSKPVSPEYLEEIDNIVYENDLLNDPFTREIDEAVKQIESFLDPYLNP
jgi:hypothetical protein